MWPNVKEYTEMFIKAAQTQPTLKHVIYVSCVAADNPEMYLGDWQASGEAVVQQSSLPYTIIRAPYLMQNIALQASSISQLTYKTCLPEKGEHMYRYLANL